MTLQRGLVSRILGGSMIVPMLGIVATSAVIGMVRSGEATLPGVAVAVIAVAAAGLVMTSSVRLEADEIVAGGLLLPHRIDVSQVARVRVGKIGWVRSRFDGVVLDLDTGAEVKLVPSLFIGEVRRSEWIRGLREHCGLN